MPNDEWWVRDYVSQGSAINNMNLPPRPHPYDGIAYVHTAAVLVAQVKARIGAIHRDLSLVPALKAELAQLERMVAAYEGKWEDFDETPTSPETVLAKGKLSP